MCFEYCICRKRWLFNQANLDSAKQAKLYDNLVEIVETQPDETQEPIKYSEDETFIPEYQELYMQNNDMVGWIKVDGTKINIR